MKTHPVRFLGILLLVLALRPAVAQTSNFKFEFEAPPSAVDAGARTAAAMRDLAVRILPVYEEKDPLRYFANLSILQMVAGDYRAAHETRRSLLERRRRANVAPPLGGALLDIYAQAKAAAADSKAPFAPIFTKLLRQAVSRLDDEDAYTLTTWHDAAPGSYRDALQGSFDGVRGEHDITMSQAIDLIRTYLAYEVHRQVGGLVEAAGAEDGRRRYVTEDDVRIKAGPGVVLHARVIRPRSQAKPLPALLEFTILRSQDDAFACAAHGYVGVMAYTRGTSRKRGRVIPFRYDGEDARAVIRWIATQPWSDGRVGMYGDGYSGFAAWAAAKDMPSALKAIATTDAMAPGIDIPATGGIHGNSAYRWVTNHTHGVDEKGEEDPAFWRALNQTWYKSGKPYRDLARLAKMPNRVFRSWLGHPSYDHYWQTMIPFREEFARIGIPVLTIAGYYAADEAGSLYYFTQHTGYRPAADDTLLIGPYDDAAMRSNPSAILRNYTLDPAARIDLQALRFQWFNHVFKGGRKPALLEGRVNYEVMGADRWAHAPSLKAMSDAALKFYLDAAGSSDRNRLARTGPSAETFLPQAVDFADRSDAGWSPPADLVRTNLAARHGVVFVSDPLKRPTEIDGLLSGRLDFWVNKMDMDFNVALYEWLPGGDYVELSVPHEVRASYARDRVHRHLLKAGERQRLTFTSTRITSRRLAAGSRLVLVLGINKRPDQEINYGTGADVSEESIAGAKVPLKVRWYGGSYIEIPVRR